MRSDFFFYSKIQSKVLLIHLMTVSKTKHYDYYWVLMNEKKLLFSSRFLWAWSKIMHKSNDTLATQNKYLHRSSDNLHIKKNKMTQLMGEDFRATLHVKREWRSFLRKILPQTITSNVKCIVYVHLWRVKTTREWKMRVFVSTSLSNFS